MFTYSQTKQFVEDFIAYTGNSAVKESLENSLLTICRSKFSKNIIELRRLNLKNES